MQIDLTPAIDTLQYGSVPDWLSAFGTLIAVFGLLREVSLSRRDRRVALAENLERDAQELQSKREEQVRRVSCWLEDGEEHQDLRNATAVVSNASEMAIYQAELHLVGAPDIPGRRIRVIPPTSRVKAPAWLALRLPATSNVEVELHFLDARGVRWIRRGASFEESTIPVIDTD